jgi:hypothetical protein
MTLATDERSRGVIDAMRRFDERSRKQRAIDDVHRRAATSSNNEYEEQKIVVKWLRARGVLFTATANGAYLSGSRAARMKQWAMLAASGVSKGVPDLIIFDAPRIDGFCGAAIELKRSDGKGRATPEQGRWLSALLERGYKTAVCHGAKEAIGWLEGLGY